MADELGSVSVTVKAETSQLEAGLAKARAETEKFDKSANKTAKSIETSFAQAGAKTSASVKQSNEALRKQQAELGELLGKINPVVAALGRLDEQEAKLLRFKKAGIVDSATFVEYKKRIDESRRSLAVFDSSTRKVGNTSKQTAQALRQLPAQFSDIVISLQSGQSPLNVFLQQGAQIKDSFGGIGPAFRQTAKFALGMINPVTASAAALAVMALAYKQGSDEATAFNTALIMTGNIAGTSVGQLENAAEAMDQLNGTQRQAAQALALVANTGKFTSDQLQEIAAAAVAMDEATGKAVSDTVAEFVRLADEPVKAAAKLNEQYHFLTASIFNQISALEAQGDAAGAAQIAMEAFGQAMESRSKKIEDNLGLIERAWKGIKKGAAEAWDEMLGIGRAQTPEQRLEELANQGQSFGRRISEGLISAAGPIGTAITGGRQIFEQVNAGMTDRNEQMGKLFQEIQDRDEQAWTEGMRAQQEQNAISAQQRIDQLNQSTISNAEKRNKALADLRRDLAAIRQVSPEDPRLDVSNVARLEKNIAEQFKDAKGPINQTAEAIKRLNEQRKETIADLGEEVRILESLSAQYLNSGMSAEQLATTGEILRTQSLLQVDANSAEGRSIEELITKRNALTGAIDQETKARELLKQETEATLEFNAALQNTIDARQHAVDIDVASIGMGQKRAALQREINDVTFEYAKRLEDVARAQGTEQALPSDIFAARVEALKVAQAQEIAIIQDGAQRKAEAEMNWAAGARQGLEDFSARATDLAGQTSELVGSTLESMSVGISDALAGAIIQGEDLRDTMANLAQTIYTEVLSALIEMGIRFVANKVLQLAGISAVSAAEAGSKTATTAVALASLSTITAASAVSAGITAAAWAPAAAVTSLASFGANSAPAMAGITATNALAKALSATGAAGFKDGGFTGNGSTNRIAGVVHGGEFVFDAASTSRIGVGNLEAIRSGAVNDSIAAPKFQERIRPNGFDNNVDGQIVNPNRMSRSDRMINQNFYIQTPDADSFRASQRQIARDTKQRMALT